MPTSTKDTMKKLIPVLSKKEKQEIFAYYTVYEKYAEEFSKKATEDLKNHPIFGKLLRDIPKEVSAANNKMSRELQKDAIKNDNWQPYIEYQTEQGITYAKMELDFKTWYEVVSLVRNYITPYLQKEYGSGAELISSLNGMNLFLDIAMGIIGEAYLQGKEGIIKQVNERLSSIYETTADGIFVLEVEQNERYSFSSVNKSFQTTTGISYNMAVGKYVNEIISQPSLNIALEKYKKAIEGKKMVRWEETSQYTTRLFTGEVSVTPLFDEDGNCIRLVGTIHDITESKRAERALADSEKRFRALIESASDGVSLLGVDGKIVYASPATLHILGITPEEAIGIDPKDYTHPDDLGPFLILLNDLLQKPGGQFYHPISL